LLFDEVLARTLIGGNRRHSQHVGVSVLLWLRRGAGNGDVYGCGERRLMGQGRCVLAM
jgi:hypothetical protein